MTTASSSVHYFDPESCGIPTDFPAPARDVGEVAILLFDAGTTGSAGRIAAEVARSWARAGVRVLLADGDLLGASLHEIVGVENQEGLSDLILYGASPTRVVTPVPGESFLFCSAGTVVADSERVFTHPRWPGLLSAFRESGTALLVLLPEHAPGAMEILHEGDRLICIASTPPDEISEPGVFFLCPDSDSHEAAPVEVEVAVPVAESIPVPASAATTDSVEGVEDTVSTPLPSKPTAAVEPRRKPAPPRAPGESRAGLWIMIVVFVLFAALLLAAWLGIITIPGISFPTRTAGLSLLLPFARR